MIVPNKGDAAQVEAHFWEKAGNAKFILGLEHPRFEWFWYLNLQTDGSWLELLWLQLRLSLTDKLQSFVQEDSVHIWLHFSTLGCNKAVASIFISFY